MFYEVYKKLKTVMGIKLKALKKQLIFGDKRLKVLPQICFKVFFEDICIMKGTQLIWKTVPQPGSSERKSSFTKKGMS